MSEELKTELEGLRHQKSFFVGILKRIEIVLFGASGEISYWIDRKMGVKVGTEPPV